MSAWGIAVLVFVALAFGLALGLGFAAAVQGRRQADDQAAELARDRRKVRDAFQCAVAQVVPMKGGHDLPAEDRMRQQLLSHMWMHHGGIVVVMPKPGA